MTTEDVKNGVKYTFTKDTSSDTGSSGGGGSSSTKPATTTTTNTNSQGVSATITTDANGNITAISVTVPAAAAKDAATNGTVLSIPVDNLSAPTSSASAPAISVSIPAEAGTVKIEIPVTNVSAGVVAILVNADGTEQIVKQSTISANGVVLPVSGNVTLKVVDNTKSFGDIASGYWGGEAVTFVTARGIFDGTGSSSFSPDVPMGRAMLAQVLYSLAGKPSVGGADFKDVSSSAWYANAVAWAAENGIVSGYPDGSFGADDSISREQLALMLWNYAGKPAATQTALNFADAANASSWAQSALLWANEQGIINGKSDTALDPTGIATRAEVAQMIMKYLSIG
jgi:hypothetical protein